MVEHVAQLGANAIIGLRYDAMELTGGVTEVWPTAPPHTPRCIVASERTRAA
jgi:hypothetical protein